MIRPVGTSTTAITQANSEVYSASSKASLRATGVESYKDRVWIALGSARKLEAEIKKAQASLQDCKNLAWNNLLEPKRALQRNLEELDRLLSSSTNDFDDATYKKEWYDCQVSYIQLYEHLKETEVEVKKFNSKPSEDLLRTKQEEILNQIFKEASKLGWVILMLEPKPVYAFGAMDVMARTRLVESSVTLEEIKANFVQLIDGFATYPKSAAQQETTVHPNDSGIEVSDEEKEESFEKGRPVSRLQNLADISLPWSSLKGMPSNTTPPRIVVSKSDASETQNKDKRVRQRVVSESALKPYSSTLAAASIYLSASRSLTNLLDLSDSDSETKDESDVEDEPLKRRPRSRQSSAIGNANQSKIERLEAALQVEKERAAQLTAAKAKADEAKKELDETKAKLARSEEVERESAIQLTAAKAAVFRLQLEQRIERGEAASQARKQKERVTQLKAELQESESKQDALKSNSQAEVYAEGIDAAFGRVEKDLSSLRQRIGENIEDSLSETGSFLDDLIEAYSASAGREGTQTPMSEVDNALPEERDRTAQLAAAQARKQNEQVTQLEAELQESESKLDALKNNLSVSQAEGIGAAFQGLANIRESIDLLDWCEFAVKALDTPSEQNPDKFFQILKRKLALERGYFDNEVGKLNEEERNLRVIAILVSYGAIKTYQWARKRELAAEKLMALGNGLTDLNPQALERKQAEVKRQLIRFEMAEDRRMRKLKTLKDRVDELSTYYPDNNHWDEILTLCTYMEDVFLRKKIEQLQQEIQARVSMQEESYKSLQASNDESWERFRKIGEENINLERLLSVQQEFGEQHSVQNSMADNLNEISGRLETLRDIYPVGIEIDAYERQLNSLWNKHGELFWARQKLYDAVKWQVNYSHQEKDMIYPQQWISPIDNQAERRRRQRI